MKIRIIPDAEISAYDEKNIVRSGADAEDDPTITKVEDDPEGFKRDVADMEEIVIPQSVADEAAAQGISLDDIVAAITKAAGKQQ